ncbi:ChaN family lipoprotein [uncultured Deefgea sp.]|uniref:ChaN family lipoprotein n=1 Tax=uncultured Deefgea sp. TaxID=1304914 RepID=UPI002591E7EE|nr:ChaN family lipoprotein [uncultured Deefgea sp.]
MKRIYPLLLLSLLAACQSPSSLQSVAPTAQPVVLLGEVHDNALGHQQRYAWLKARIKAGWRPAIAMEQFDVERQADIDQARAKRPKDVDFLIKKAGGARWDWPLYRPIIQLAMQYDLPLLAANLSRQDAATLMKNPQASLTSLAGMDLNAAIAPAVLAGQRQAVQAGHCGKLPLAMEEPMARAQIARDRLMAQVMTPYLSQGVVLIAGNGHTRRDIGVAQWLPQAYSVGFVESEQEHYFDEVHPILAAQRPDPCATLQLNKS